MASGAAHKRRSSCLPPAVDLQAAADGALASLAAPAALDDASPFRRPQRAAALSARAPRWVPDEFARACASCGRDFGLLRRRHHCRGCGEVFCDECSRARLALPHLGFDEPVRACATCAAARAVALASAAGADRGAGGEGGARHPAASASAASPGTRQVRHGDWF